MIGVKGKLGVIKNIMELARYYRHGWEMMHTMNSALVIQSVVEWLKQNFAGTSTSFVEIDYLVLWTVQDILLLYALVLEALPVTQADSLKENVLVGHLKMAYFSAISAIQSIFTKIRCPYEVGPSQKKNYVCSPLVQLMRQYALKNETLTLWRTSPMLLAAQMLMPVRPGNITTIRELSYVSKQLTQGLVDVKRLIAMVEHKYMALYSSVLEGLWVEAVEEVKKNAQTMNIRVNDPNLWVAAIWYMENSGKFHKLIKQVEPAHKKVARIQNAEVPVLPERETVSERFRSYFTDELMHSVLAAYLTYQKGLLLGDTFYEKAKLFLHNPLQLPPPRITEPTLKPEIYAYVIWTMPPEIDYARDDEYVQQLAYKPVASDTQEVVSVEKEKEGTP